MAGRPESAIGQHCARWNSRSLGLCFDISGSITQAQQVACFGLRGEIAQRHGDLPLIAHSDLADTPCPGPLPWDDLHRPLVPVRGRLAMMQSLVPTWRGPSIGCEQSARADARVLAWQAKMRDRGWRVRLDGEFEDRAASVLRDFQTETASGGWCDSCGRRITIDGVLGPQSWEAAWTAPVTERSRTCTAPA